MSIWRIFFLSVDKDVRKIYSNCIKKNKRNKFCLSAEEAGVRDDVAEMQELQEENLIHVAVCHYRKKKILVQEHKKPETTHFTPNGETKMQG
jgi:hypothetical protein